jgi:hypothetical protein
MLSETLDQAIALGGDCQVLGTTDDVVCAASLRAESRRRRFGIVCNAVPDKSSRGSFFSGEDLERVVSGWEGVVAWGCLGLDNPKKGNQEDDGGISEQHDG